MNQAMQLKTACRCAQFCMLRMSVCVASFMLLSTMVSPMLKVCLSLYTLLRSHLRCHLRSHLFVNCCIRRYFLYREPTSFLDHVYLRCTQRQCEISKDIVDNYRTMFESRNSAAGTEKLPYSENLVFLRCPSFFLEGHAKICVERYCDLANKTTSTTLQSINSMHR